MDNDEKIVATGLGCYALVILAGLAFWGTVIYVALHFIAKLW